MKSLTVYVIKRHNILYHYTYIRTLNTNNNMSMQQSQEIDLSKYDVQCDPIHPNKVRKISEEKMNQIYIGIATGVGVPLLLVLLYKLARTFRS